jgi:hypothetical protein
MLKNNGYRKIKLQRAYNYLKNWNTATMVYTCKFGKEKQEQVLMPKEYEFDVIFKKHVKPIIKGYDILHIKKDVIERGLIFNLVLTKENITYYLFAVYHVNVNELTHKITELRGEQNAS